MNKKTNQFVELVHEQQKINDMLKEIVQDKPLTIKKYVDDVVDLKQSLEKARIETERVDKKLISCSCVQYVLDHILPKPTGKDENGEDVYGHGGGVGYHHVPPPLRNGYARKKPSGVEKALNIKLKLEKKKKMMLKMTKNCQKTLTSHLKTDKTNDDMIESENESDIESTKFQSPKECFEDEEYYFNNYIPKSKNNSDDDPTLVMYQMCGSDKVFLDEEFLIQNVNMDKIEKVYKLVEVDVSKVEILSNIKRLLNFKKDKAYYNKPRNPRFQNKNLNNGRFGQGNGEQYQKKSSKNQ
ncbi:hypothetical protein Hanom_Chr15g01400021 [Helianthus anomalus]